MKLQTPIFIILLSLMYSLKSAQAQTIDGFHEHDGFYLSLATGFGEGNFQETNFPGKLEMWGGASNIDVKVGGTALKDHLIVSGDLIGSRMIWPRTRIDSVDFGRAHGDLKEGLIGLGVTYYFMPVNVFLSGTLGVGGFTYTANNTDYNSDRGLGFQLKFGKEWWISKDWGIGASMFYLNQHVNESNDRVLNGGFAGFMFNTTFN